MQKTIGFLEDYAKEGLRTLLIAYKEVDEDFYWDWAKKYTEAATSINREKEINKVAELIEQDFILIGSSAIEDKL